MVLIGPWLLFSLSFDCPLTPLDPWHPLALGIHQPLVPIGSQLPSGVESSWVSPLLGNWVHLALCTQVSWALCSCQPSDSLATCVLRFNWPVVSLGSAWDTAPFGPGLGLELGSQWLCALLSCTHWPSDQIYPLALVMIWGLAPVGLVWSSSGSRCAILGSAQFLALV